MKQIYQTIFTVLALMTGLSGFAQYTDVLNNGVNYEFTIEYNHYFNASPETGNSEPVIRTDIWISSYGWIGESCHTWECEPDCYDGGGDDIWWAGSAGFDDDMQVWMLSYESDNSDHCNWYADDDDDWQGTGVLRDGQTQQRLIYQSSNFRPCQIINSLGNAGSGWLFPDNPSFNQILQLKWRYAAGDESTNPLDFGTINNGQSKSDINSNRSVVNVGNYVDLEYTNTSGQSSADAWYSFTVNEPTNITISTNHGETDFDTYLTLYTQSGDLVAIDDDGGSNNSSIINTTICPGTYVLNTEGYSGNTGIFKVSVSAATGSPPSVASWNEYDVSCPGMLDGSADWLATSGVPPYTYQWNGSSIGSNSHGGLGEGTYNLVVIDACGTTGTQAITISNGDETAPVALCQTLVEINVWDGNTTTLDALDVDDGSSDNCGIDSYSISPSQFDISDVGANSVTLTVTDENGNSHSCSSTVYALNTTGVEETTLLESMSVFPNPNNGSIRLQLNDVILEGNANIRILNAIGSSFYSAPLTTSSLNIDLQDLTPGVYVLQLNNDGVIANKRIILAR